jgi:hypothetical protein
VSPWFTVIFAVLGVLGSATINLLIVGYYIGKYQGDLRECQKALGEMKEENREREKELREDQRDDREMLSKIRERLKGIESKINGTAWKREA